MQGDKIVEQARTWLGTKYHHQGRLKKSKDNQGGVDCIGLIIGVAQELGIKGANGRLLHEFDETGYSAYPDGVSLKRFLDKHLRPIKRDKLKPGHVLLFKLFTHPQHVGIASNYPRGGVGIIYCYSGSGKVVEHILSPAWQRMIVKVYRFRKLRCIS